MKMCYLIKLHGYVDIVQEIVNKGAYINVKGEYAKVSLDLTYENNFDKVIFGIIHGTQYSFFCPFFLFHKL
jgi:hypothetical protein